MIEKPLADALQVFQFDGEILPPDGYHVYDLKAAFGQNFFQTDNARFGSAAASAGMTDTYNGFEIFVFVGSADDWCGAPPKTICESPHAFTHISVINGGGKDYGIGAIDVIHYTIEIILYDTPTFRVTDAPPVLLALTADL